MLHLNIDFENIHNKLLKTIEKSNIENYQESSKQKLDEINDIAKISSALIVTALKIYHSELINQLKQS